MRYVFAAILVVFALALVDCGGGSMPSTNGGHICIKQPNGQTTCHPSAIYKEHN